VRLGTDCANAESGGPVQRAINQETASECTLPSFIQPKEWLSARVQAAIQRANQTLSPPDPTVLGVTFDVESDGEVSGDHMLVEGVHIVDFMSLQVLHFHLWEDIAKPPG
jgi:hypothetical protein